MHNTLQIGPEEIPYTVTKSKGRRIRIGFQPNAPILVIHTPDGRLSPQATDFVRQQEKWILKHFVRQRALHVQRLQYLADLDKGKLTLMGQSAAFQFIPASRPKIRRQDLNVELHIPPQQISDTKARRHYMKEGLRMIAKDVLVPRVHHFAQQTDSRIQTVRIKDHKSKWGSCSDKRNINLNWHLLLLEEPLIDYVIIHELMHLREMNHSARFWKWVETYYPQYKEAEAQLKNRGWLIGILD